MNTQTTTELQEQINVYAESICFKLGNNTKFRIVEADRNYPNKNVLLILQGPESLYFWSRETRLRTEGTFNDLLIAVKTYYKSLAK